MNKTETQICIGVLDELDELSYRPFDDECDLDDWQLYVQDRLAVLRSAIDPDLIPCELEEPVAPPFGIDAAT
jgi:hypothetical protein